MGRRSHGDRAFPQGRPPPIAAEEHAFNRVQELDAAGDMEGKAVWLAILRRIAELNVGRRPGSGSEVPGRYATIRTPRAITRQRFGL